MHLIKEHQAANRQDLIKAAERLADIIQDYLDKGEPVPIININGSVGAGKSLFWDFVKQKLLGSSATFLEGKSKSSCSSDEMPGRIYETWTKQDKGKNEGLTLFLCNVNRALLESFRGKTSVDLEDLRVGKSIDYGDVIILTNTEPGFIPEDIKQLEISVTYDNNYRRTMFPINLKHSRNFQ